MCFYTPGSGQSLITDPSSKSPKHTDPMPDPVPEQWDPVVQPPESTESALQPSRAPGFLDMFPQSSAGCGSIGFSISPFRDNATGKQGTQAQPRDFSTTGTSLLKESYRSTKQQNSECRTLPPSLIFPLLRVLGLVRQLFLPPPGLLAQGGGWPLPLNAVSQPLCHVSKLRPGLHPKLQSTTLHCSGL